jgi:hypothetical protein
MANTETWMTRTLTIAAPSDSRFDSQRASGPFGVDEVLPKKIETWVSKKHPDSGKNSQLHGLAEGPGHEDNIQLRIAHL